MKALELRNKLIEITGDDSLTFRVLYAKTNIGESHGNFVELRGNFTETVRGMEVDYENESYGYASKKVKDKLKAKLREAGLNVYDGWVGKGLVIAVEVDVYYYGDSEVKNYDLRTEPNIHINNIGNYRSNMTGYYLSRRF